MASNNTDLGAGVWFRFVQWSPDYHLNPQYDGIPPVPRFGAIIGHTHDDGEVCEGSITFDLPEVRQVIQASERSCREKGIEYHGPPPMWTVEAWEPLTLSPSILMDPQKGGCGLHGFIRDGRWVSA